MSKKRSRKYDIRIGERDWVCGSRPDATIAPVSMDEHFGRINPLFDALESECMRECCGLHAFGFWPSRIEQVLLRFDVHEQVDHLRKRIASLEGMDAEVVSSKFLGEISREKKQVVAILRHILSAAEATLPR
ncbi:MAG: hypothetical protein J0L88_07950 [Xanthomonadales bacterium]|nr:hypothetical protein [Xanthomonadales bacterium]